MSFAPITESQRLPLTHSKEILVQDPESILTVYENFDK